MIQEERRGRRGGEGGKKGRTRSSPWCFVSILTAHSPPTGASQGDGGRDDVTSQAFAAAMTSVEQKQGGDEKAEDRYLGR